MPRNENLSAEQHEQNRDVRGELFHAHVPVIKVVSGVLKAKNWDEVPAELKDKLRPTIESLKNNPSFIHHSQVPYVGSAASECLSVLEQESFGRLAPAKKHAAIKPHLQRLLDLLEASQMQHTAMSAYHGTQAGRLRNAR